MEVTYLPDEDDVTPAFPSALLKRQMENVLREIQRHREVKEQRGHMSLEDKAMHFHIDRIVNGD